MIPHIPNQRQHAANTRKPFDDLIDYVEENKDKELKPKPEIDPKFAELLEYATNPTDKLTNTDKCLALRTNGISDISVAAVEMNAVSAMNIRCKDPAFHFILSWPEHEQPQSSAIFDAAEHAIKALGLGEHQYVLAIHGNTDNRHCHIAVNRIHPVTYKAQHLEWAKKTLHYAARESEIKHGWTHDKGIYLVETNHHGNKTIILNPELGAGKLQPHAHIEDREPFLPTWHDNESMESWLQNTVSRPLKRTLPKLQNWHGLHAFLDKHNIVLTDTGGGGMRLKMTSQDTGEILDIPASKGLRLLKRSDLEKRWGPFTPLIDTKCIVPDSSNLTQEQLAQGARNVLNRNFEPRTPYNNILHAAKHRARIASKRNSGMHELPAGSVDGRREYSEMLLPDAYRNDMGDTRPWQDQDLRRAGHGEDRIRELNTRQRNDNQRQQRKEERAAARADLRQRYSQYKTFVRQSDPQHTIALKVLQTERRTALTDITKESNSDKRAARKNIRRDPSATLISIVGINAKTVRRKLQIENRYQQKATELRSTRQPPIGWREWLHEQSNLGDQAAISALRGIVYQAQRDAKKAEFAKQDDFDEERAARDAAYRDDQHRKVLSRLLDEEKFEIAIRSAHSNAMRPHEIDALLIRYTNIQWKVTGNGNVEYSDRIGTHLFTDRGNRLTFDRQRVTDQEIKLALLHAQQKFGKQITLTGEDPIFSARMARLADDMGLIVLNPDLQTVITEHRAQRYQARTPYQHPIQSGAAHGPAKPSETQLGPSDVIAPATTSEPAKEQPQMLPNDLPSPAPELSLEDSLRAKVLAIDPHSTFIHPVLTNSTYIYSGPIAASHQSNESTEGFAQHIGRSQYVLHSAVIPPHNSEDSYDIRYHNQIVHIVVTSKDKSKGHNE